MAFDHVGIVVGDLREGGRKLQSLLPIARWTDAFHDDTLGVSVSFGQDHSGMVYEIIAPLGENSPVARVAASRHDRLNQIAYRTSDFAADLRALKKAGAYQVSEPKPAKAFGGANVVFLMPQLGFLIELIEDFGWRHDFRNAAFEGVQC
jgi:methylmalonyl-CoA/ethylmalonyl-CoA epimerase